LLDTARAAGLAVTAQLPPAWPDLPAAVDRTAYRILQEALTNAAKHGPGGSARVTVDARDGALEIDVISRVSDVAGSARAAPVGPVEQVGPLGPAGAGTGFGLLTMRDRAQRLGGQVEAVRSIPALASAGGPAAAARLRASRGGAGVTAAPDTAIRVLVVDDHAAVRAGIAAVLETAGDVRVVGEAGDGATAVRQARALRPDVVLMDLRMPGSDGVAATRAVVGEGLADVLVLTVVDADDHVLAAVRAGAAGFLLKTVDAPTLVDAVRRVAAGEGVMAPEIRLGISEAAVKTHVSRVLDKLGCTSRVQAALLARELAGPAP
jgi:DNA-binding NarL/FixJ family response regulator